jgi:hypothetical protein
VFGSPAGAGFTSSTSDHQPETMETHDLADEIEELQQLENLDSVSARNLPGSRAPAAAPAPAPAPTPLRAVDNSKPSENLDSHRFLKGGDGGCRG